PASPPVTALALNVPSLSPTCGPEVGSPARNRLLENRRAAASFMEVLRCKGRGGVGVMVSCQTTLHKGTAEFRAVDARAPVRGEDAGVFAAEPAAQAKARPDHAKTRAFLGKQHAAPACFRLALGLRRGLVGSIQQRRAAEFQQAVFALLPFVGGE